MLVVDTDADIEGAGGVQPGRAHDAGDLGLGLQTFEFRQVGFGGRHALGFDRLGVEEGVVEIAQLLLVGCERGVGLGLQLLEDRLDPLLAENSQLDEGADPGAVRRNLGGLEPGAVHIFEEVVAGLDGLVHCAEVDAPFTEFRFAVGCAERRCGRQARTDNTRKQKYAALHSCHSDLKRPSGRGRGGPVYGRCDWAAIPPRVQVTLASGAGICREPCAEPRDSCATFMFERRLRYRFDIRPLRCYLPWNLAGRFCRKACTPSMKSALRPAPRWAQRSALSCSS